MGLQINLRQSGDVTILELAGRVVIGPANDQLASQLQHLLGGGVRKLLMNVAGVTQIDSSGISTLVRAFLALGKAGGSLRLAGASGRVLDVLSMMRLRSAIPTFEDEESAIASFR